MSVTISVAIATYNGEKYLREQLDSLYGQTRKPDEIVVCDDCSTDSTVQILEEYSRQFGLIYYINETNLGYNKNFQRVLSLCTGDFICICDQDDVWLDNKIEVLLNAITFHNMKEEPVVVVGRACDVDADLSIIHKPQSCPLMDWHDCVWGETSQGCSIMMNRCARDFVLPVPNGIIYDAFIGISVALCGEWYKLPDCLMKYRYHGRNAVGQMMRTTWKQKLIKEHRYGLLVRDEHFDFLDVILKTKREYIKAERLVEMNRVMEIGRVQSKWSRIKACFLFPNKSRIHVMRSIISILLS